LKRWFHFAECSLFYRALLQKRPTISRRLLIGSSFLKGLRISGNERTRFVVCVATQTHTRTHTYKDTYTHLHRHRHRYTCKHAYTLCHFSHRVGGGVGKFPLRMLVRYVCITASRSMPCNDLSLKRRLRNMPARNMQAPRSFWNGNRQRLSGMPRPACVCVREGV